MLFFVFRIIFFVIILAVIFVNVSAENADRANSVIVATLGLGLAVLSLLIDMFTPKKSLAGLAGVFFGLLVGMFISWAFSPILDFLNDIYLLGLSDMAVKAIRWVMSICICYLVIMI